MSKQNGGIIGPDNVTTGGFNGVASGVFKLGEVTKLIRESKWPEPSPFPTNITPNSIRFNDGSSDKLARTPSSNGSYVTNTWSFWVKRSAIGADQNLFNAYVSSTNKFRIRFNSNDTLQVGYFTGVWDFQIDTTRVFRDVSAFYNIVITQKADEDSSDDRIKIYVNGVRETSFATNNRPSLNEGANVINSTSATQNTGASGANNAYFDGYMSEVVHIDGTAYQASSFGEFNSASGIWVPKSVAGLTFGTNGYYLKFANSGSLGTDSSGQSNNLTVTNLTSLDQSTDSPSNNFATLNILDDFYTSGTISEGNLTLVGGGTNANMNATIGLDRGKWYWETRVNDWQGANNSAIGISSEAATATNYEFYNQSGNNTGYGYYSNGSVYGNGGTPASGYGSASGTHIIGVALDLDNNKIAWSYDGTFQGSSNPATGANMIAITAPSSLLTGLYFPAFTQKSQTKTLDINFGNPSFAISSGNTDGSGFGNFEYAVPTGYVSLCTNNLNLLG